MSDQRKSRRFELRLPIEVYRSGSVMLRETSETSNLSSGGVLFRTETPLEIGELIEYRITLPANSTREHPIQLHCKGKVVRQQYGNSNSIEHIAATLERYEFIRTHR